MHVHSLLPILSLSFVTFASAQDNNSTDVTQNNSTQVATVAGAVNPVVNQKRSLVAERGASAVRRNPFKRAQAGICDALPGPWSYMGWSVNL